MGWSGGTEIFDCVAEELESLYNYISTPQHSEDDYYNTVLQPLMDLLERKDWDAQQESDYYDHPVIGKILGNTFGEGV